MASVPVDALPLVGSAPLHPPDPAQEDAFAVDEFKVAELPATMLVGVDVRVTAGASGDPPELPPPVTVTVAVAGTLPPGPEQVSV